MTTGMKVAIGSAIAGALFGLLNGHVITAAWASLAAFWMWKHARLEQQYKELANRGTVTHYVPGRYWVDPEVKDKYGDLLDQINQGKDLPPAQGGWVKRNTTEDE